MKWAFLAMLMFPIQFHPGMPCSSVPVPVYIPAQFPYSVNVLGKKWKIISVHSLPLNYAGWTIDDQEALDLLPVEIRKGRKIGEILVLDSLPDRERSRVLLHELQHAILGTGNLMSVAITTHMFIDVSANRWAQVLRDNPELVRFVSEH